MVRYPNLNINNITNKVIKNLREGNLQTYSIAEVKY